MSILSLIEKVTHRPFSEAQIHHIVGTVEQSRLIYAADGTLRARSASGGSVTALLLHLLDSNQIDGALVLEGYMDNEQFRTRFFIARNREELLHSQGSKYVSVNFNRDAVPLIDAFDGRLAVVALPCDTTHLRRMCERDPALKEKVKLVITLFCGHNCDPRLTEHVIERQKKKTQKPVAYYQNRVGHWRGEQLFVYNDGSEERVSRKQFKNLFNLYFFCEQKCLHCIDQFGYDSDISIGDLWHSSMKENPIKMAAVLSRTPAGERALQSALDAGKLDARALTIPFLVEGHSRTVHGHYNISARAKVGRLLGIKIKDTLHTRVTLFGWLTAFIILVNYRLSTTKWGRKLIFAMPTPLMTLYLYLLKGLESFE